MQREKIFAMTEIQEKRCSKSDRLRAECGGTYYGGNEPYLEVTLPEIIVTPDYDNNHWNYDYDPNEDRDPNDYFHFNDDTTYWNRGLSWNGNTGNNSGQLTDSQLIARGMLVANAIQDSINNDTAIIAQKTSDSAGYKFVNSLSYGTNFAVAEADVYSAIFGNPATLKSFGTAFGASNFAVGLTIALIGIFDGEQTTSDYWALASAISAGLGLASAFYFPPAVLVFDGISIICGAVSIATSNQSNQDTSTY